jgi:hypothetical protein
MFLLVVACSPIRGEDRKEEIKKAEREGGLSVQIKKNEIKKNDYCIYLYDI